MQEREHRPKMRIRLAATNEFSSLQPDDFGVCFREGANFLNTLLLERHQPHKFDRIVLGAQLLQRGKVASGGVFPGGKGVRVTFMSMPSNV